MREINYETMKKWFENKYSDNPEYMKNISHKGFVCYHYGLEHPENRFQADYEAQVDQRKFQMIIGGEKVQIDSGVLTFNLRGGLNWIGNNKYNWKPNSPYAGVNELILLLTSLKNLKLRIVVGGKAYFVPKDIIQKSISEQWISKMARNCLKILAIPINKTEPERKQIKKQFKRTLYNYIDISNAVT